VLQLFPALERGQADHGWLRSAHTFSFAGWQRADRMGFRGLRVINEDRVQPGKGFATHSHRDMEIVSYVLEGALEHRDSLGNGSVIRPGDVQLMSAGTGVTHSEYNASDRELVHFLQIWILPAARGTPPSYQQEHFTAEERSGQLRLVVSPDARDGSLRIGQDAEIHAGLLGPGQEAVLALRRGRHGFVHVARGAVALDGHALATGDAVAASALSELRLHATAPSEVLVFDLA
jgi:redox-sensitive bicupin YhaK (pirin superfamily)